MLIDKGPVLLDIADGIARLRLNRPDSANGMSAELLSALCDAIMVCHGQPDLRVLLLSGEGTNFCAGGDVRAFASKGETLPDYIRQATAYLQNAVTGLLRLARQRRWPRPSVWFGPGPAPASNNACPRKRAPCPNCLAWPTRGKGSPPSSSGANPSLRDASQCRRAAPGLSGGSMAAAPSS